MNVLLIGSGGREHSLAWKLAASPLLARLFAAPGNPGMAEHAQCVALDVADHAAVAAFCRDNAIDLVVVGPEAPLVAGLTDDLEAQGVRVFGPSRAAAQLEGSKNFTKELCAANAIPTARHRTFRDPAAARAYAAAEGAPIVIKADGLAAGKGVIVAMTDEEAEAAIGSMFTGTFGAEGERVVIEEFMQGEEVSLFCLVDGETVLPFGSAQDHKRAFDGDEGPNTGGMGAYSPAPVLTAELEQRALDEIVRPTARAMVAAGMPYRGVLYAGLMLTAEGPKLVEYNCRFGDPECQVLMRRLRDDILTLMLATVDGTLAQVGARWTEESALAVVMATRGYPGSYPKGSLIRNLGEAGAVEDVEIFHAGTVADAEGVHASGGRVLNVTATGSDLRMAREKAYRAVDLIDWPEGFCRRDIGWRELER